MYTDSKSSYLFFHVSDELFLELFTCKIENKRRKTIRLHFHMLANSRYIWVISYIASTHTLASPLPTRNIYIYIYIFIHKTCNVLLLVFASIVTGFQTSRDKMRKGATAIVRSETARIQQVRTTLGRVLLVVTRPRTTTTTGSSSSVHAVRPSREEPVRVAENIITGARRRPAYDPSCIVDRRPGPVRRRIRRASRVSTVTTILTGETTTARRTLLEVFRPTIILSSRGTITGVRPNAAR